jgi:hypothetical protein
VWAIQMTPILYRKNNGGPSDQCADFTWVARILGP